MPRVPSTSAAAAAEVTPRASQIRIRNTKAVATTSPRTGTRTRIRRVTRRSKSTGKRSQMASTSQRIPANPAAVTRAANLRATRASTAKASTKRYVLLYIK